MATLATLAIDLTANSAKMVSELNKANSKLDGFAKSAETAGKLAKVAFAAATTGIFASMVKESVDAADRIGKLSQRLGASTESLSELRHVADLSGVSFNTLTMGLQRATRRISEAAAGSGEAKKALQELGISATALNQLAPEEQFEALAEALSKVESDADRVRLAMKFFDSEGVALIQTMGNGAAGIREMREEARKLGLSLSNEDAQAAAIFNDQLTRAQATLNGIAQEIATNSVTAFNALTTAFNAASGEASDSAPDLEVIQDIIKGAGAAAFITVSAIQSLGQGIVGLQLAVVAAMSGDFKRALSELQIGAGKAKKELEDAYEFVTKLYGSGDDAGGGGEDTGSGKGPLLVDPNQVNPLAGLLGADSEEETDPLKRILGKDPAETMARLEEQLMSEEELLTNGYVKRQETLAAFLEQNAGFEQRYNELSLKNLKKYNKAKEDLEKRTNQNIWTEDQILMRKTLAATASFFGVMASENKAFAVGQALINTYLGVSESLAAYPMPLAAVMAATHLAAGMKQVQAIKSGSGSSSVSTGTVSGLSGGPDSFIEQSQTFGDEAAQNRIVSVTLNVDDDAFLTKKQLRRLTEEINEAAENSRVRISV